jgi:hypothetical protein
METYIYILSDSEGIRYVGKSNNPEKRFKIHLKESKKRRTQKEIWIHDLLKSGQMPKMEILETVDESDWSFRESYWISQLKSWGFNILNGTAGGEGSNGFKGKSHSEETKKILSKRAEGRVGIRLTGEKNGRSKITENTVIEIKRHLKEGKLSYQKIANLFENVTKTTVAMIKSEKRWSHIKI